MKTSIYKRISFIFVSFSLFAFLGCTETEDLASIMMIDYVDEYGVNHGQGVEIDGVVWAPVNCGFHETDFPWGKLYQGGRFYGQGYSDDQYSDAVTPQVSSSSYYGEDNENNANTFFAGSYYYIDESDWNAGTDSAPVKGAHDPCPEGWTVPTST